MAATSTPNYQLSTDASNLLGPDASNAANQLYSSDLSTSNVRQGVNDLFSAQSTAAQDLATSQAQNFTAAGNYAEADAYTNAANIADQNARLARVSGQIQQYQQGREAKLALSSQRADVASAGFGANQGTALDLMRSSRQQAALGNQLIGVQSEITAGGFEQQGAAQRGEAAAARVAGDAATLLGQQAAAAGVGQTTAALNNAMSLLAGDTDGANGAGTKTGSTTKASPSPLNPDGSPSPLNPDGSRGTAFIGADGRMMWSFTDDNGKTTISPKVGYLNGWAH